MPARIGQRGTPLERFMAKVNQTDDCWEWTGHTNNGYGRFSVSPERKSALAHRVMYEWAVGPIPPNHDLDHLCHNPCCVRPDHLEPVPHLVNISRNSRKLYCPHGHWLTGMRPSGTRYCKECKRVHYRANIEAEKAKAREYQQRKRLERVQQQ